MLHITLNKQSIKAAYRNSSNILHIKIRSIILRLLRIIAFKLNSITLISNNQRKFIKPPSLEMKWKWVTQF